MARPLRIEYPGAVYHITSRGNARQDIFLDDDNREEFVELVGLVVQWPHGHVFQEDATRRSLLRRRPILLELTRYVVLNPVRAKMVCSSKGWRCSSYRATARPQSPLREIPREQRKGETSDCLSLLGDGQRNGIHLITADESS